MFPLIGCTGLVIIGSPLRATTDVPGPVSNRFQRAVRVAVRFLGEFNAREPGSSVIGGMTSNRRKVSSRARKETRVNHEERNSGDGLMMDCGSELFYAS